MEDTKWIYNGMVVGEECYPPDWAVGFVYQIEHRVPYENGERTIIYVGKKLLQSSNRKKIGIREKKATGTRKTYKVVKKDSGWNNYWGSSKTLHATRAAGGEGEWTRRILKWCYSKKNMSYEEMRYQILADVMNRPSYNDHIGNFYARDISIAAHEKWKEEQKNKPKKSRTRTKKQIPY